MEIKTLKGQSLFDIAIQAGGSVEAVISLAVYNDLSLTDELTAGQDLINPDITKVDIVDYYRVKGLKPKTAETMAANLGGIGYMAIETTFIVS